MVMIVSTAGMSGRGRTGTGGMFMFPSDVFGYANYDFEKEVVEEPLVDEEKEVRKSRKAAMDRIRHKRNKERRRKGK